MPKVIEHLRENLLCCARRELLAHGYDALTLRGVAHSCGIAVGTTYNYFPSKDMLVGAVMLEDWQVELERMRGACAQAADMRTALTALYGGVLRFSGLYSAVWAGYTFAAGDKPDYMRRHNMLVEQLSDCLAPVLKRCGAGDEALPLFLAENVLICANNPNLPFESFLRMMERILQ